MTVRCTCFAPITGYTRSIRNYCTPRPDTMLPENVKENDPAVAWLGLQRIPNHPNSGGTCYADTLQVWFPAHWAPVVLQQLQKKEDRYRAENPSWMDEEEAPADIPKQWQEDVCSSRSAIIGMAPGRATSGC